MKTPTKNQNIRLAHAETFLASLERRIARQQVRFAAIKHPRPTDRGIAACLAEMAARCADLRTGLREPTLFQIE